MKKILFVGATHGNEVIGVDALREIEEYYDKQRYGYDWIVGNPRALEQSTRFIEKDLNRSAPGNSRSLHYEERRAAEIVEMSADYDVLIDLHGSVASCGIVTIIPYPTRANMALAMSIPVKRGVVWYSPNSAKKGPLAQHVQCPAVEIECGPKKDVRVSRGLRRVIGTILEANVMCEEWPVTAGQEFYSVYGVQKGAFDPSVQDFKMTSVGEETFFPFMSNQYEGTMCYKMQTIDPDDRGMLLA